MPCPGPSRLWRPASVTVFRRQLELPVGERGAVWSQQEPRTETLVLTRGLA